MRHHTRQLYMEVFYLLRVYFAQQCYILVTKQAFSIELLLVLILQLLQFVDRDLLDFTELRRKIVTVLPHGIKQLEDITCVFNTLSW
jgi:hypothetical protein